MPARYAIQILLLSAVWGVSFLMMRIAVPVFPPAWISMLRCALGAGLLYGVLVATRRQLPPRSRLPWLLLVAALNNALPFTFFAWGERTVPSNIAAVLNATTPIWSLLLTFGMNRSSASPTMIAGVLLSFGGVLAVVVSHAGAAANGMSGESLFGIAIIAVAALCYAIATVIAKSRLRGLEPLGLATAQLTLATLMLLPVALGGEHPAPLRLDAVGAIAVLGFAGSGIAYLLYYRLLAHVSPTQVVAVTYLLPIWGLFWGACAGEAIGLAAIVGVAITICGLVLMNLRREPAPAPLAARPERAG